MKLENTYKDWFSSLLGSAAMIYAGYGWHQDWVTSKEAGIVAFIGFVLLFLRTRLTQVISDGLGRLFDALMNRFFGKGGPPPTAIILLLMLIGITCYAQNNPPVNARRVFVGLSGTPTTNTSLDVRGPGDTNGTTILRTANNSNTDRFSLLGDGSYTFRLGGGIVQQLTSGGSFLYTSQVTNGFDINNQFSGATDFAFRSWGNISLDVVPRTFSVMILQPTLNAGTTGQILNGLNIATGSGNVDTQSPTIRPFQITTSLAAASGTATYQGVYLNPTYNTTSTYVGTARGFYYNPTLTSTVGLTNIAFENTSGELRFGGVTQDNTKTQMLAKDATTNRVFWRDASSISSSTTIPSGQIAISNGTSLVGDANLTYGAGLFQVGGQSIFTADNAANNSITSTLALQHTTTGVPAVGIGTGLNFVAETAAGNNETGVSIEAVTTDVTNLSEDFDLVTRTMTNGTIAESLRLSSIGDLTLGAGIGNTTRTISAGGTAARVELVLKAIESSAPVEVIRLTRVTGNPTILFPQTLSESFISTTNVVGQHGGSLRINTPDVTGTNLNSGNIIISTGLPTGTGTAGKITINSIGKVELISNAGIDIQGSVGSGAIATITAAATLSASQCTILADATTAAFTVTLPVASGATRRIYRILKKDSSVNAVTVSTTAGGNLVINTQYSGYVVQSDGTSWYKIGSF